MKKSVLHIDKTMDVLVARDDVKEYQKELAQQKEGERSSGPVINSSVKRINAKETKSLIKEEGKP